MCAQLLLRVRLFVTPWTVALQALLFMGLSRQEYWSMFPFPPPGHLPDTGIKPASLALAGGFLTAKPSEKHKYMHTYVKNCNRIERFNINKSSFSIIMSFQRHSIHTQANM